MLTRSDSIFLAGDAAHTHSPLAGQGLNISVQDAYNLVWKIGSVIADGADPMILETYEKERRPIAEHLMEMDRRLNQVYADQGEDFSEMKKVRDHYSGAISGLRIVYEPNLLIREDRGSATAAKFVALGARLPPSHVVSQDTGSCVPFEELLPSDGSWKLLIFLRRMKGLTEDGANDFLRALQERTHLSHISKAPRKNFPRIQTILIRPRIEADALNPIGHSNGQPFPRAPANIALDTRDQLSIKAVFDATETHQPYQDYGIDETAGAIILCRPDQHVALIDSVSEWAALDSFFSLWVGAGK